MVDANGLARGVCVFDLLIFFRYIFIWRRYGPDFCLHGQSFAADSLFGHKREICSLLAGVWTSPSYLILQICLKYVPKHWNYQGKDGSLWRIISNILKLQEEVKLSWDPLLLRLSSLLFNHPHFSFHPSWCFKILLLFLLGIVCFVVCKHDGRDVLFSKAVC